MNKTETCLIPSQSARSRALASAVDSPTTLTGRSVWDEMKFVLETITSSTGPRSLPVEWHIAGFNTHNHTSLNYSISVLLMHNKYTPSCRLYTDLTITKSQLMQPSHDAI